MAEPRIGVTLGDPAGIGPEIVVRALAADGGEGVMVFGDRRLLDEAAGRCGVTTVAASGARIEQIGDGGEFVPGCPDALGAAAQVAWLEAAVAAAQRREIDGLCTAPIHKAAAKRAGFSFPGHTEFLAARFQVRRFAMMLAGPHLRVVPVTSHLALQAVARALSVDGIASALGLTIEALHEDFGIARPRVAVCGLNPHAGEGGHFGDEEQRVIAPAMHAVEQGPLGERIPFTLSGPHVPDAVFRDAAAPPHGNGRYDAVVAMYHDQGLIPIKLIDFEAAVNVTLGLPLPRTSPDHGVAYDIAGTGRARDGSMRAALRLVRQLATRRRER